MTIRKVSEGSLAVDPVSHGAKAAGDIAKAQADAIKSVAGVANKHYDLKIEKVKVVGEAITAGFETIQSALNYMGTREEWRGKVAIAQQDLEKARLKYDTVLRQEDNRELELKQLGEVRSLLISSISDLKAKFLEMEAGPESRHLLDKLVEAMGHLTNVGK